MSTPSSPTAPDARPRPRPLYSLRGKLVIAALLALAVGALALGVSRTQSGTDDQVATSGAVPLDGFGVRPAPGSEVLRQVEIGIDLEPGYEATLVVEGAEIPASELRVVAPENQVFFTPGPGKVVERLSAGTTCVTAVYWRSAVGRGHSDGSHTWCFSAT